MATKGNLTDWVYNALEANGGRAKIAEVAEHIWKYHQDELRDSGDLFYTWQYDMRWAAQKLRDTGRCASVASGTKGIWELKS